jgi:DNA-binding NarL/FixJ family response regulator
VTQPAGSSRLIKVAVADDQPVICAGFAALLDAQPDLEVVGRAHDGSALVDLVDRYRPDLALVDIRMPGTDGIEATRMVTGRHSTRVLVLTTFDLDEYVFDALRAGASGFLLKDVTAERLVEAVRLVADGSMLLGPAVTRRLVADFARRAPSVSLPPGLLSPREHEVLLQLARGRSNAEIAKALLIGVETVRSHVAEVLRKLGLRDRVQAVVFAYESGLVTPGE